MNNDGLVVIPIAQLSEMIEMAVKKAMDIKPEAEYLTKKEAAERMKCSEPMIDKLVRNGQIDKHTIGTKVLISLISIKRYLNDSSRRRIA